MSVKWTEDQQKVIDLQKRNILVSAAAGSGKTAVLVERIIQRIMDETNPVDIDRFLLMTFTEAAAAEMKERIAAAIEKKLEEDPSNLHLKKQSALVRTAKITTIHSFCLFVIREYFHTIHLDPSFRIGEDGELKLIKQEAVEELLEQAYEEKSSEFLRFAEQFAVGKEDKELEGIITRICDFAESYPNPEAWLNQCVEMYYGKLDEENGFLGVLMEFSTNLLTDLMSDAEKAIELCQEADGPYMYLPVVEDELALLSEMQQADSFELRYNLFEQLAKWKTMPQNRDKNVDKILAEQVKNLRAGWKAGVEQMKKEFFFQSLEEMEKDMKSCLPVVECLVHLVKEFRRIFKEKKLEKNLIDFNDMEHLALSILTREEDGVLVPSENAKELSEQFEEILIDEYQDSNYIQEALLNSVSKISRGEYNIFRVGDVKQSIYRFRLSRPELFMEKYESYTEEDSVCQRIDLSKNFRSRKEVVAFVNSVFSKLMIKQIGNVEYDSHAALYVGADYPSLAGKKTEIMLIEGEVEVGEGGKKLSSKELEAKVIAERIHELMKTQEVWDRKLGMSRPVQYKDIVVLIRSMKGWSDVFVKTLKQEGIPAYADSRTGYFSTLEVGWILDYLKVLDNYRQDIPLAAVLKSPFGNCTNEELAVVREAYMGKPFYEAVFIVAGYQKEEGVEQKVPMELRKKLGDIFAKLEYFRDKISYTAIHDLLWEIFHETGFGRRVAAMPGGEQRYANLLLLIEKAKAFESTSYRGLFHFVRYIEQLREYDVDYGEADIFGESTDAVRIMSIHKSKGLEYPIVILAGMGKSFNLQDTTGNLVIHPKYGIGMYAVDLEKRTRVNTLLKNFMQKDILIDNLGEEMRVLYVALTRAKEKLILTGVLKKVEQKIDAYECEELSFSRIMDGRNYFSWVMPAIYQDGIAKEAELSLVTYEHIVKAEMEREQDEQLEQAELFQKLVEKTEESYEEHWREQFEYQYPEQTQLKLKYSVSELKQANEVEDGEALIQEEEEPALLPKFLQEEQKLTGASRGSTYHKVMELLDFEKTYDLSSLEQALSELLEQGYLNQEMKECIWKKDIVKFMNSDLGLRMHQASLQKGLWREQPFVFGIPAKEMYPETKQEDFVLIQGIMDAYFKEDDEFVIVDYKTDRVKSAEELMEKYQKQLDLYGRALEQITGKKVKEKVIYSFTLGKEIAWGRE